MLSMNYPRLQTPRRIFQEVALVGLAAVLLGLISPGCGGGGKGASTTVPTRATGDVLFTIQFPEQVASRAIPPQTEIIQLSFKKGDNPIKISSAALVRGGGTVNLIDNDKAILIGRPAGQGAQSVTVRATLPTGDGFTASAEALTNSSPFPIAVATDVPVPDVPEYKPAEDNAVKVTLTLGSKVRSLKILADNDEVPGALALNFEDKRELKITATDGLGGKGNPVVFDSKNVQWTISDANKAKIEKVVDSTTGILAILTALQSTFTGSGTNTPVTITATFDDKVSPAVSQKFELTVKPKIVLLVTTRPGESEANGMVKQGGKVDIKATVSGANKTDVEFSVKEPRAVSVTGVPGPNANETTGVFTAPTGASAAGDYVIEARVKETGSGANMVVAKQTLTVAQVTVLLTADPISVLKTTGTSQVTAKITGAVDRLDRPDLRTLTWSVDGGASADNGTVAPATTTTNPATVTYTAGSLIGTRTVRAQWGGAADIAGTVNITVQ